MLGHYKDVVFKSFVGFFLILECKFIFKSQIDSCFLSKMEDNTMEEENEESGDDEEGQEDEE